MLLYLHGENMTELLQRVIEKIQKLPNEIQDAIAARLLADLEDEQAWATRFEATTDQQWDLIAEMVRQEIADGETVSA